MARQVLLQLVREKLQVPAKIWGGPRHGQVTWKEPDLFDVIRLLHNPTYAGAYVYGQMEYDSFDRSRPTARPRCIRVALEEWPVCLRDAHPAYITWEQFVKNQEILRTNGYGFEKRGAPRQGRALLQGIVYCGRCGLRMTVLYYSTKEKRSPGYGCFYEYHRHGGQTCQCFSCGGGGRGGRRGCSWTSCRPRRSRSPCTRWRSWSRTTRRRASNGTSNSSERTTKSNWHDVATRPRTRRTGW